MNKKYAPKITEYNHWGNTGVKVINPNAPRSQNRVQGFFNKVNSFNEKVREIDKRAKKKGINLTW